MSALDLIQEIIFNMRVRGQSGIALVCSTDGSTYADQLEEACKGIQAAHKRELDEAATFINKYLEDSAIDPKAHNWLIRNGYQDASYQADTFGQEIAKEGDAR